MEQHKTITVALAGQPNTGKSTVFNMLTGSKQHVGNWPGKTVEQKTSTVTYNGSTYRLVDLPGTYSLTANSLEETIARDFIIEEQPDVVVVIVDAAQLERTLYLVAETLPLPAPVIVALNMMDVAEQEGRQVNAQALEAGLGVKVVPMVAAKNQGVPELLATIHDFVNDGRGYAPSKPEVSEEYRSLLADVRAKISGRVPDSYPEDWVALKMLEGDEAVAEMMRGRMSPDHWDEIEHLLEQRGNGALVVASGRYEWIQRVTAGAVKRSEREEAQVRRGKFDKIATHPVWGMLIGIGILLVTVMAAMMVGMPISMGVMSALPALSGVAQTLLAGGPAWLSSLVTDGLISGVGVAAAMLPWMVAMFLVTGFLEDVGYMARVAYVADRVMQRLGLHGKSFMPLFMSLTCNISGVLGTRVVASWRQRMMTLVMASIVPCLAVWGVTGFISALFFGAAGPLVILAMLAAVVLQLFITSVLLGRTVLPGEHTALIMELPPYHKPNWRTIWGHVWTHSKAYLKRGATIIAMVAVLIWALSYLPSGNIETSFLASFGRLLEPVGKLMGMDWRLLVSLVAAFVSKEGAIATMAVIYGVAEGVADGTSVTGLALGGVAIEHSALGTVLAASISPASALAFVFAMLFSLPCIGTVGAIYSETKSLKWTLGSVAYYTATSVVAGIIAYQVGLLVF